MPIPLLEKEIEALLYCELPKECIFHRRIADHVRDLIISDALPPGTKLPSTHRLAALWKTNYFSVQTALASLASDQYIERRQRRGSFVKGNPCKISKVSCAVNTSFFSSPESGFFRAVYLEFARVVAREGVTTELFVDTDYDDPEPFSSQLEQKITNGEVQALFGVMMDIFNCRWIESLTLPRFFCNSGGPRPFGFAIDMEKFLLDSFERLKARGCRTVGLITTSHHTFDRFHRLAIQSGLKTNRSMIKHTPAWPFDLKDHGTRSIRSLMTSHERPDGIVIYPDRLYLYAGAELQRMGLRVPEDLKVVCHGNAPMEHDFPAPADWAIFQLEPFAQQCWDHLKAQSEGKEVATINIVLQLFPPSADLPPILYNNKASFPPY